MFQLKICGEKMWEGLVSLRNTSFVEAVPHYCFGDHFLMSLGCGVLREWMYQMPEWHQFLETKLLQVILLFFLSCSPFTLCENMLLGINRPTNRAGETNKWASGMLYSFDVNYEERHYTKLIRFLIIFFAYLSLQQVSILYEVLEPSWLQLHVCSTSV